MTTVKKFIDLDTYLSINLAYAIIYFSPDFI